ncbi:MAG: COP23 domain-containing protein [Gomphosphaeria aponina SAG 52.96 = DSM 107014]|uniref:COP23 domain-containing protein n=1 Tax=Gomphosphaeria aponina SAG 52.96 = DSM 107014 TaxID=1521640 RepID=A0A941GUW3_9CHRO|nr:COP23 domain-containing protein [Gomphosphaeria aponina SAG 52.96 = DSM 107014]
MSQKIKPFFSCLRGIVFLSSLFLLSGATFASTDGNQRFTCETFNGEWTVMYYPPSQSSRAYPWAVPNQLGGGWTSDVRCREISQRLELYRLDGLLELQTSIENGQETICVTTQKNPSCRIVLTVPPGQNAAITLELVFKNLVLADSGQPTLGINTFTGDNFFQQLFNLSAVEAAPSFNINLLPFLHPADGGTGTQL